MQLGPNDIGLVGTSLLIWMGVVRITGGGIGDRPALIIGVLCVVVGVQMVSLGLLAELFVNLRRAPRRAPIEE